MGLFLGLGLLFSVILFSGWIPKTAVFPLYLRWVQLEVCRGRRLFSLTTRHESALKATLCVDSVETSSGKAKIGDGLRARCLLNISMLKADLFAFECWLTLSL